MMLRAGRRTFPFPADTIVVVRSLCLLLLLGTRLLLLFADTLVALHLELAFAFCSYEQLLRARILFAA